MVGFLYLRGREVYDGLQVWLGEIFERGVRLPPYVIPIPGKGFLNVGG